MQYVFGSGLLFVKPLGADSGATTPQQVGALQGISVDMAFSARDLHGLGPWPLAIGRGTGKIACKAAFARLSASGLNAIFFGGTEPVAGSTRAVVDEAATVAANTATAAFGATFSHDLGVVAPPPADTTFTRVAAGPVGAQYTCNETTGVYGFAAALNGANVRLSYTYSDAANGRRLTLPNRAIGYTPRFAAVLTETFNGKKMTLILNRCTASRLSMTSRLDDFMLPDFSFAASADDSSAIGSLSMEEGDSGSGTNINLNGITNAGTTSAVGVTLTGLDPAATYRFSEPAGLTYTAWRTNNAAGFRNHFVVTTTAGRTEFGNVGTEYGTAELARAAFVPGTITGYSSYTFWLEDPINPADNSGGLSILMQRT